ncbi:MAG: hypothetical protein WB985_13550 [Candidatus Acidiferrales bacterium]
MKFSRSILLLLVGCLILAGFTLAAATQNGTAVSPAEARAIAKEAYIYGFPLVDSYRIEYGYFVDAQNPGAGLEV